jgi:hypothetical protein
VERRVSTVDRIVTATPVSNGVFGRGIARADETPGTPDFPGLQRRGNRLGFRSEFRPPSESGVSSKRIREASPFDIAEDAGRGYAMPGALTETALVRKFSIQRASTAITLFGQEPTMGLVGFTSPEVTGSSPVASTISSHSCYHRGERLP